MTAFGGTTKVLSNCSRFSNYASNLCWLEQTNSNYSSWSFPLHCMISNREYHDGLTKEHERQECEKIEPHDRVVGFKFDWFQRLFAETLEDLEALLQ
jgi:hypothetical protein